MAQLTIYLPDALEKQVRLQAKRAKKSVSAFIAELASKKSVRSKKGAWAQQVEKLYGSWVGEFPEIDDPPPEDLEID